MFLIKSRHYNLIDSECVIIKTPCDNPKGCRDCYHEQMEDYRAYIAGEAEEPYKVHNKRLRGEILTNSPRK